MLSISQSKQIFIDKLSPVLKKQVSFENAGEKATFVIAVSSINDFRTGLSNSTGINTIYEYKGSNVILIRASWGDIYEKVLPLKEVLFIDIQRTPKEEVAVSNLDLSTNKVNVVHRYFPQYNGNGFGVSVKENRPDTADIDFKGRYVVSPFVSGTLSSHATIMATIIAGAGNTYYEGRGVANGALISSVDFANLLPEPPTYYQQYNISVQNHSYGTAIENYYGADASSYDASVISRPSLVHVFSAGNSGLLTGSSGTYSGIPRFANLTGSFKMAKNIITVGHTDSFGVVLAPSSRGPAYDGRVKPELVAFGEDGSSGAAAIVSGTSLLLQHAYKDVNGSLPSSSLIKAVLLNSADETANKGIDFSSGYGALNAIRSMETITGGRHVSGSVVHGAVNIHSLMIPPGIRQIKITLVWNDPPAMANAARALVNDVDLELALPLSGETWSPWVLSHFPHPDSLAKLPVRKRDTLNTVEQVTLDLPVAGIYEIRVKGAAITSAAQSYSFAYQFDTLDKFRWYYPTNQDNITGGSVNTIRWESFYTAGTGKLEYSIDNGNNWQTISNTSDLGKGYYKWNAPDSFVTSLLKMSIGAQTFQSETFTISKRLITLVGFNCPDSFLFYWNKARGVTSYQVYKLGDRYMEPLIITTDTAVVLGKGTSPSLYYAVAPILGSLRGVRSYGFNYTTQGVGCYVRSFFASLSANSALLELELGTLYQVSSVSWQKLQNGSFRNLRTIDPVTGLTLGYTDDTLITGSNIYRVMIKLKDGRMIYSEPVTLYYFGKPDHIVYPNPGRQQEPIYILNKDAGNSVLTIYNAAGVKVYETKIRDLIHTIAPDKFRAGMYLLRFTRENKESETLKLIIN